MMVMWDNYAVYKHAEEKGIEKGIEKGRKEGKEEGRIEGKKDVFPCKSRQTGFVSIFVKCV